MTNRSIVAKQKTLAKIYERYIEVQIFNWVSKSKFFINISMMCLNTSKNFVFFLHRKVFIVRFDKYNKMHVIKVMYTGYRII